MIEKPAVGLSADRPSTDPKQDLFGQAPFAKTLAKAIRGYRGRDGIVLALYGPWGSGKSTVLAYVEHELEQGPELEQPVVVTFNPWWFSGQENLAKAFLGQMQAVLPAKHAGFKALGNKLAEFGGALGGVADLAGGMIGFPLGGKVIEAGAKLLATQPRDVPALKKAVSDVLLKEEKRVLVVIDDIDRLAPDEVRQLFTVIKALADFPYVTYLLAFDREVAAAAIDEQTGLPGDRYLEKIIQVPFELPKVDRSTLAQALIERLNAVMTPTPDGSFDQHYWSNIFYSGLNRLFTVPRDIVRLTNVLSVTYPAVVGEVNPVDFIAVECLRLFLPAAYDAIRTSPDEFCGYKASEDKARAETFHQGWLENVPVDLREMTKELVQRLFPRLDSVWSNTHYTGDSLQRWRTELRVCVPDIFPAYFRLSLPEGAVTRADVNALLSAALDSAAFSNVLHSALTQKTPKGASKARELLERLMDHLNNELDASHAEPVINALLDMGDQIVATDRTPGEFDFGSESRVGRVVYHLLMKIGQADRCKVVSSALKKGYALRCGQYLILALVGEVEKEAKGAGGNALISAADVEALKSAWVSRLTDLARQPDFIDHRSLAVLLDGWRHWGDEAQAKAWWAKVSSSDEGLTKLISAFQSEWISHGAGDHVARVHLRCNPKVIEPYGNVHEFAARLQHLLNAGTVSEVHAPAVKCFIAECERMRAGKNPNAFGFEIDD